MIPKNLTVSKESVNKLSIEDLRMICFTFGLAQDRSKSSLKKRLLKYHRGQFTSVNGAPAPTPRKMFALKSQKSDQPILFIIDQLRKSDQRFDEIEFAVTQIGAYVNSL